MDRARARFDLFPHPDLYLALAIHVAESRVVDFAALVRFALVASGHFPQPWLSDRQLPPSRPRGLLGRHPLAASAGAHRNS